MNIFLPMPMWLKRRLAQRNPWLLADGGKISRSRVLKIGPLEIEIGTTSSLTEDTKAKLLAERDRDG